MPVTLVTFDAWVPDSGDVGPHLAVADNLLPVHQSFRLCQQKQVQATLAGDGPVTGALVHTFQQARTVLYARPSADIVGGPGVGSEAHPAYGQPLYQQVNESTPSDAAYILVPAPGSGIVVKLALSPIAAPGVTSGHVIQFRYAIPATTGAWTIDFYLQQQPAGTNLAHRTVSGSAAQPGFLTVSFNLTTGEAAAITDYTKLALQWTIAVPGTGQPVYPSADTAIGGWLGQPGAISTNLWQILATFPVVTTPAIVSKALAPGASDAYSGVLAPTALDPITRTQHALQAELAASNAGVTLTLSVLQGAAVVAQQVLVNAPTTPHLYTTQIPEATAAGITDYTALTCSIVASYPVDVPSTQFQTPGVPTAQNTSSAFPLGVSPPSSQAWQVLADASDATYVYTQTAGTPTLTIFSVPTPTAPSLSPTGYVIAMRASGSGASATLALLSYTGTVIDSFTVTPAASVTAYSHTLGASAAAAVDALIPAGQPFQLQLTLGPNIQVARIEFDAATPRSGICSFLELAVPPTSAAEISWADLEAPDPLTSYKGDVPTIYAGTPTKLYTVSPTGFTNVSASGGYAAGAAHPAGWQFLQVGADVYATNYVDPIQARLAGAGLFAPLISDPSPAPQARHMAIVRQFLLLGDINLTGYGPDWIWWSAGGNFSSFTPSLTTQSGNGRVSSTPGQIMGLVGGDNAVIFKRNAIHSLTWTGDQSVFRLDEITRSVGTPFPRSIVLADDAIYFWGGACFWRLNPYSASNPVERVGDEVLASYMADPVSSPNAIQPYDPPDMASEDQVMVGWYDRAAHLIFWEYQGLTDTPWQHGKRVCYSPTEDRWSALPAGPTCYEIGQLNVSTSDSHFLRGTLGFDYGVVSPGTTSWYKYNGTKTLQATLKTQRRSIGLDKVSMPVGPRQRGFTYVPDPQQDYEIWADVEDITPVWSSTSPAVAPQVSITVECANNPLVRPGSGSYRTQTTPWLRAGETFAFPVKMAAYWWIFTVNVAPISLPDMLYAFHGLYVTWHPRGRK